MAENPQHKTLVADTVTTVTFDRPYDRVEVMIVRDPGVEPVYFRTDGTDPGVEVDGSQVTPAVIGSLEVPVRPVTVNGAKVAQVKVISAGTPKISVRGINV